MAVEFKHCNINFEILTEPYEKLIINITRPGKPTVSLEKEDFCGILNALMDTQHIIKSRALVQSYYSDINSKYLHHGDPELYLLATKVNQNIKISIIGFQHNAQQPPTKLFTIFFDQEDDLYKLNAEFIKFINEHGSSFHVRLYIE
jgi:hypothetical protein